MPLSYRENFIRNASLDGHEWIPATVVFVPQVWHALREELEDICLRHPVLFPGFQKGQTDFDGYLNPHRDDYVDEWGCRWTYELDGLEGLVVGHPLEDWDAFEHWKQTIPRVPEWSEQQQKDLAERKQRGDLTDCRCGGHGFFLMRLYYLRGFENFMLDVATEDPRLDDLIEVLASYYEAATRPYIEAGIDLMWAADDLGTQTASMLSPKHFRRYLMPTYQRLFLPARRRGTHVHMHHDGYIMDIAEELMESGVSIVNPQDLANGIDAIAKTFKGRVAINCDIDRQKLVPFGSPGDVRELIKEEVMKLGSPAGGLSFICGVYYPTPAANIDALCGALEKFRTYWVGR